MRRGKICEKAEQSQRMRVDIEQGRQNPEIVNHQRNGKGSVGYVILVILPEISISNLSPRTLFLTMIDFFYYSLL